MMDTNFNFMYLFPNYDEEVDLIPFCDRMKTDENLFFYLIRSPIFPGMVWYFSSNNYALLQKKWIVQRKRQHLFLR